LISSDKTIELVEEKKMKDMNPAVEELTLPEETDNLYTAGNKAQTKSLTEKTPNNNIAEPDFKHLNDKELVSLFVKTHDEDAFNEIVDRYGEKIFRTALRITGNTSGADDVLQEVFVKLVEKLETFHGKSKFSTWLYSVSVNASFAYLRGEKKYKDNVSYEEYISDIEGVVSNEIDTRNSNYNSDHSYLRHELIEKIEQAVNELPTHYRVVFHLRDVEGLTNPEVATILGLSVTAVKFRIRRARLYLRHRLSSYLPESRK
jgi:RNA polymerase sigma-70 factor, ECF subfamily